MNSSDAKAIVRKAIELCTDERKRYSTSPILIHNLIQLQSRLHSVAQAHKLTLLRCFMMVNQS